MSNATNIDNLETALNLEYAKYDRIMGDAPDFMTLGERHHHMRALNAQRGRIEGLVLAIEIIKSQEAA